MTDTVSERTVGLPGLLPDGMQLLASCFDANHTIGGGLFAIGDTMENVDRISSSGLDWSDGLLFRVLWAGEGSSAELVVYDAQGVRRYHRLDGVSTPHDILVVNGNTYVVATTQNEVQCIGPDGEVVSRWRAAGEDDSWHLNSLARSGDRMMVCSFGPFLRRRGWDESKDKLPTGRVVDMETGEPVLTGLTAPHNPYLTAEGTWLVCDSAAGQIVEMSTGSEDIRRLDMPGWPRGLLVTDDYLFVGLSPHRKATTSVASAAVAAVDRRTWQITSIVTLPAREVYALALVPTNVVEGARNGFRTNVTRVQEQGQRQLFDKLGLQPRRLWALGDKLEGDEIRARITIEQPVDAAECGSLLTLTCQVRNLGTGILTPAPPFPVRVVHTWFDEQGEPVQTQVISAPLPRSLPPEAITSVMLRARVPATPGGYRLHLTLAQDEGARFDETDPEAAAQVEVQALPSQQDSEILTRFGLYPSEVLAAFTAGSTVEDMVRALLTSQTGAPRGLTRGLIEDLGETTFVEALATTLGCSPGPVRHAVRAALADPADVLLTGAEAVALAVRRSGARVAFAYAGTSELVLCDAFARLGMLVNGRGDRESLFEAGGASRIRPGIGVAILHAARGLTNAMGALADLRRNEIGLLALVGMPSSASAAFLPPHGEPDLIASSAAFAKSAYQVGAVPADQQGRRQAVTAFVEALHAAFHDLHEPAHGPVLLGLPQDVSEGSWVPLSALPEAEGHVLATADTEALESAAAMLTVARRPLVIVDDYALVHEDIRPALAAFCESTGAVIFQLKYRRGAMLFERLQGAEVPCFLGWYDPSDPAHVAVVNEADVVVTIEDRNMYPRVIGELGPARKIALTTKPEAVAKNGYLGDNGVMVVGGVVPALKVLADACSQNSRPDSRLWYQQLMAKAKPAPQVSAGAAAVRTGIAKAIGAAAVLLGQPAVLVDDSQMFGGMLAEEYDHFPTGLRVFGGHGGFVGSGITIATGLALGEPSVKVLCTLGDQGFTNSMQGLVAAVQEKAPVTFVVCNNGGSVSLRKQSRPAKWLDEAQHPYLENAAGMDYTKLASALGVRAQRVDLSAWQDLDRSATQVETFAEALATAAADRSGPTLIEVVLPSDPDFWTGVWNIEGFEQASKVPGGEHAA